VPPQRIESGNAFVLPPVAYPLAVGANLDAEEKCEAHELIITERKTDFFMDQYDSINSVNEAPFVFSFFENNDRFERCYVDAAFLAAAIDIVLL